jgi:hypothetical protein
MRVSMIHSKEKKSVSAGVGANPFNTFLGTKNVKEEFLPSNLR